MIISPCCQSFLKTCLETRINLLILSSTPTFRRKKIPFSICDYVTRVMTKHVVSTEQQFIIQTMSKMTKNVSRRLVIMRNGNGWEPGLLQATNYATMVLSSTVHRLSLGRQKTACEFITGDIIGVI